MKILFSLLHPGYLRHYEPVLVSLAEKGHKIQLVFSQMKLIEAREGAIAKRLAEEYPNIRYSRAPARRRNDVWRGVARSIRGTMDFLRYLDPLYANAPELRNRVGYKSRSPTYKVFEIFPFLKRPFVARFLIRLPRRLEANLSSSPGIVAYLEERRFNAVLVTPLINFASEQEEFIKAARHLKIPCAVCVASWDNLTNKGLIRQNPDRVIVWNETQKREAVDIHGLPERCVAVTGAQSYDHWFEQEPSEGADEFRKKVGLDPGQPYVLYMCSSPFIAGRHEVQFVKQWARAIRESKDEKLRNLGILVRPHPQNAEPWAKFDHSYISNFALYPKGGSNPVTQSSKGEFYDSMYHSAAVVGINTSGMIEAGIVGKPVLTVLAEGFKGTQTGTLHFHYLVEQGLVNVARDLDEHIKHLSESIAPDEEWAAQNRSFVQSFVRPYGLDEPATPRVVNEIETLARDESLDPQPSVFPKALLKVAYFFVGMSMKLRARREAREQAVGQNAAAGSKDARPERQLGPKKRRFFDRAFRLLWAGSAMVLGFFGLKPFARETVMPRLFSAASPDMADSASLNKVLKVHDEIREVVAGDRPIIVGPWLSEVGFEVLYWVPFVRYMLRKYLVDPKRVMVVTRGGAGYWYQDIAASQFDIYDLFDVDAYRERLNKRWRSVGGQKQTFVEGLDEEILAAAKKRLGTNDVATLFPHVMYNAFRDFWRGRMGANWLFKAAYFGPYPHPGNGEGRLEGLPEHYIAVRFYFRPSFPDTEVNRAFIQATISRLLAHGNVVLLNPGFEFDDHVDFDPKSRGRLYRIEQLLTARNNLEIQSKVIQGADAFVGTYGGLSYLPLFYGVPSIAFYSERQHFVQGHLDLAARVARKNSSSFVALGTGEVELLNVLLGGPKAATRQPSRKTGTSNDHLVQAAKATRA